MAPAAQLAAITHLLEMLNISASDRKLALWKFQSLDEVKTLVYMDIYILSRLLSLEEYFILNIVED